MFKIQKFLSLKFKKTFFAFKKQEQEWDGGNVSDEELLKPLSQKHKKKRKMKATESQKQQLKRARFGQVDKDEEEENSDDDDEQSDVEDIQSDEEEKQSDEEGESEETDNYLQNPVGDSDEDSDDESEGEDEEEEDNEEDLLPIEKASRKLQKLQAKTR